MTVATRPPAGPPREYHFPHFERHTLENGLSVIVAPVRKLPIVSVAVVIDAAAVDDPRGLEGLAELTALALREGTASRDGIKLALDLEMLGTSVEAGADWDSTLVSITVLKDKLVPAFEILAEVITAPAFAVHDIDRLKAERVAERMQILAEPRALADESFSRFIYSHDARYAEPMSGTSSSVTSVTRDKAADFYAASYAPSAVTIIIAGDVNVDEGVRLVDASFGSWQGRKTKARGEVDKPARTSRAIEIVSRPDAAQSEVRVGHVGVPRSHADYFDIVVMNAVLGGLFSSRINLNLREEHGYTYGASSYYDWRRQSGPFVISTAVQSEVTANAIAETLKEIERMQQEEISDDELTLATSYLSGVFPIRYETTASIASALASLVVFSLPRDYYDVYRARIAGVTSASVLKAARAHVHAGSLQITVVGNPEIIQSPVEALGFGPVTVRQPEES